MKEEITSIVEALKTAIQMELKGKDCYHRLSEQTQDKLGNDLFNWLSEQEDRHRKRFEEIFNSFSVNNRWPVIHVKDPSHARNDAAFLNQKWASRKIKTDSSEIEAVATAMEMENETKNYYDRRSANSKIPAEKSFYEEISKEEQSHYFYLADYREYLLNPAGWFVFKERHSLDGG